MDSSTSIVIMDRSSNGQVIGTRDVQVNTLQESSTDAETSGESDEKWLKWVEYQFKANAGDDHVIDRSEFKKTMKMKESFLSNRFFHLLDKDRSGMLTQNEILEGLKVLAHGSQKEKLKFLFDVYDVNGNGTLEYEELHAALRSCMGESSVTLSQEDLDRLTEVLLEEVDLEDTGVVAFHEFYEVLETKYPTILENLSLSVSTWLKPDGKSSRSKNYGVCSWHYMSHNVPLVVFVLVFFLINLALFAGVTAMHILDGQNAFYAVARGSGMSLNFDASFVLVFMLRLTLNWIRSSPIGAYFPMDSSVFLHRMVGFSIAIHALIHTVGHLGNIAVRIDYIAEQTLNGSSPIKSSFGVENTQRIPTFMARSTDNTNGTESPLNDTSMPKLSNMSTLEHLSTENPITWNTSNANDAPISTNKESTDSTGAKETTTYSPLGGVGPVWSDRQKAYAAILWIFTLDSNIGWMIDGFAYISGVILDLILIIMVACSLSCVRRSGHFEIFYWTHFLYLPFWILTFLHGPRFFYFFAVPGFIFIIEKIYLSPPIRLARLGKTYITKANLLPSRVTHLVISRPEKFHYKAGDYIFINIPEIALYEWHPFTISSAPEMTNALWVHVRSEGHWTSRLHKYIEKHGSDIGRLRGRSANDILDSGHFTSGLFSKNSKVMMSHENDITCLSMKKTEDMNSMTEVIVPAKEEKNSKDLIGKSNGPESQVDIATIRHAESVRSRLSRGASKKTTRVQTFTDLNIRVEIQGPFGTATRDIFEVEHAVLIAAGIGVTPYASILQSIMYRYIASKKTCPRCQYGWYEQIPDHVMKLKRVDFIWINRDQRSFEWFLSMLTQLEKQQAEVGEDFLQMQLYLTAAASENDIKGLCLQMALDMMRNKQDKDLLTGLRTKTRSGRPDWEKVFKEIDENRKGQVKVFFCGSRQIAKMLRQKCMEYNFGFSKEQF